MSSPAPRNSYHSSVPSPNGPVPSGSARGPQQYSEYRSSHCSRAQNEVVPGSAPRASHASVQRAQTTNTRPSQNPFARLQATGDLPGRAHPLTRPEAAGGLHRSSTVSHHSRSSHAIPEQAGGQHGSRPSSTANQMLASNYYGSRPSSTANHSAAGGQYGSRPSSNANQAPAGGLHRSNAVSHSKQNSRSSIQSAGSEDFDELINPHRSASRHKHLGSQSGALVPVHHATHSSSQLTHHHRPTNLVPYSATSTCTPTGTTTYHSDHRTINITNINIGSNNIGSNNIGTGSSRDPLAGFSRIEIGHRDADHSSRPGGYTSSSHRVSSTTITDDDDDDDYDSYRSRSLRAQENVERAEYNLMEYMRTHPGEY